MNLVYVAGLVRSGTTFLHMLLSRQPGIVSLGEIEHSIRNFLVGIPESRADWPCSCGEIPEECVFWGVIRRERVDNRRQLHRSIIRLFEEQFQGSTLVDSSKSFESLNEFYLDAPDFVFDLKVLFVVRDFRGWALSVEKYQPSGIRRNFIRNSYLWKRDNARLWQNLKECGAKFLVVSYDRLVFDLDGELARIGQFLGYDFSAEMLLDNPKVHELYGSPTVKFSRRTAYTPVYDGEWLSDLRPVLAAPFLAPVYRFNRNIHRRLSRGPSLIS